MNTIIDIVCIVALVAVAAFFGWSARECADENKIRRVIARIKKRVDDRMTDNLAAEERCKTAHFGAAAKEDLDILSILDRFEAECGRDECIVIEPFKDGDAWCYLLGQDLQRGIAGFGGSPADAKKEFFANLALALDKIERHDNIVRLRSYTEKLWSFKVEGLKTIPEIVEAWGKQHALYSNPFLNRGMIEAYSQGMQRGVEWIMSQGFKMCATFHKSKRIGVDCAWIDFDDKAASKAIASGMFDDGERIIVQIRKV